MVYDHPLKMVQDPANREGIEAELAQSEVSLTNYSVTSLTLNTLMFHLTCRFIILIVLTYKIPRWWCLEFWEETSKKLFSVRKYSVFLS